MKELAATEILRPVDPCEYGLAVAALAHGRVGEFIDEGLARRFSRQEAWSPVRQDMTGAVTEMLLQGAPTAYMTPA